MTGRRNAEFQQSHTYMQLDEEVLRILRHHYQLLARLRMPLGFPSAYTLAEQRPKKRQLQTEEERAKNTASAHL